MKFQTSHVLMFLLIFDYVYHTLAIQLKQPGKNHKNDDSDPFSSIGIPELDAKQILDEIDKEKHKEPVSDELNTIDDLPNFLKYSKLSDDDAMAVLTRFLLQDDVSLKDLGAVYDHTGFDGMKSQVKALPEEPEERAFVRARSAATIYMKKLSKPDFSSLSAEAAMDEVLPNWRVFTVSLANPENESFVVKVCLPMDESLVALCSDKDEGCSDKAKAAESAKRNNEDYLSNIRSHYFLNRPVNSEKKKVKKGKGKKEGFGMINSAGLAGFNGMSGVNGMSGMNGMNGLSGNMFSQNGFLQSGFNKDKGLMFNNIQAGIQNNGYPNFPQPMQNPPQMPNIPNTQQLPSSPKPSPLPPNSNMMYNFKQSPIEGQQSSLSKPQNKSEEIKSLRQRIDYLTGLLKKNNIPFDEPNPPRPAVAAQFQQPFFGQGFNQFGNGGFMQPQPVQDMNMGMFAGNATGGGNSLVFPGMYPGQIYGGMVPMYGGMGQ